MDRIDEVGPGTFEILDYKTGGFWRDDWKGTFAGGRRLQHALYGLAAVELLKARHKAPRVTKAVYYFSSHKGGRERLPIAAPTAATLATVLGDLRDVILAGQFIRTASPRNCTYCNYAAACGDHTNAQAKAKAVDARFPAFGRLTAHE